MINLEKASFKIGTDDSLVIETRGTQQVQIYKKDKSAFVNIVIQILHESTHCTVQYVQTSESSVPILKLAFSRLIILARSLSSADLGRYWRAGPAHPANFRS